MSDSARQRVAAAFDEIARIATTEDANIFLSMADRESALAQVNEQLPLAGLTFAVKDNIDVAGLPTTAACPSYSYLPRRHATVVERLVNAGATCVGKTNMDQFATGLVGTRSPYGVPLNPLNPQLVPGGSSSGSAVAVARGLVDFALGTDTAGSGRVPAAHTGIVGLKPTRGLISTSGVVPAVRSIDCVSLFARDLDMAWQAFLPARGFDYQDPFSRPNSPAPFVHPNLRVGIPSRIELDSAVDRNAWDQALTQLRNHLGVETIEVDCTALYDAAALLYEGPWVAERYAAVGAHLDSEPADADPIVARIICGAKDHTAVATFRAQYQLAELHRLADRLWQQIDILMVPTVPGLATLAEVAADPVARNSRLGLYTNWVNLLDQCAITAPGPLRDDNIPSSITLIGPGGADALLAATAARWQGADVPPDAQTELRSAYLDLAVVGAHLRGQPLNWQLTEPGGCFVRTTATSADYRLIALANSNPPKPGLVHSETGQPIEVEIWRMPIASIGGLLRQIPPPLGLGTLHLIDGSSVPGFIAEPRALNGADDITTYGGWRAYRASLQL